MIPARFRTIRRKLIAIIMFTTVVALLLAGTSWLVLDAIALVQETTRDLSTLAGMIGESCIPAIERARPAEANETLARLRAEPAIVAAWIHGPDGTEFAAFQRDPGERVAPAGQFEPDGFRFHRGHLLVARPLIHKGVPLATVGIEADLRKMATKLRRDAGIVAFVVGATLLVAYLLSARVQRVISDPILKLATAADTVSTVRDYSVRVPECSGDETGTLIKAFNEMLTQVEARDAALRDSEERVRLLLNSTAEAIFGLDLQGRCTFCNSACLELLGYEDPGQLLDKNMHQLIHHTRPDGSPYPEQQCRACAALHHAEGVHVDDEVLWRADGTSLEVEYWSYPIRRDGAITGAVVTFLDITGRRQTEAALRDSEERFRSLVAHAAEAIFVIDAADRIVDVNELACVSLGYPRAELLARSFSDVADLGIFGRAACEAALLHEVPFTSEASQRRSDGSTFPAEIRVGSFEFGQSRYLLALARDITERKRVEAELTRHRNHLEDLVNERTGALEAAQQELVRKERLATLGRLTATVAHEIRNPLGAIRNAFFVIRRAWPKPEPKIERSLSRVEENLTRCDRIIQELLDYTRGTPPKLVPTEIDEWLGGVLREETVPAGITLAIALSAGVHVAADRERLRRCVVNLLTNAYQAIEESGSTDGRLEVGTVARDGHVYVRFADNGPGIAPEDVERVFEPLYSTRSFGVGLGLPIVRQAITQHGGSVEIESEPGKGVEVTLVLPILYPVPTQG